MANHNRAYYRRMRAKHIRRKKRIVNAYHGYWYYPFDGMYSKGKIHCSCIMCRNKTCGRVDGFSNDGSHGKKHWKHSDKTKLDSMDFQLKEYI